MKMSAGKLLSIEAGVVMVLAIMWCWSMSMTPSWAQQDASDVGTCWVTIDECVQGHVNDTSNPEFDPSSPSFNATEFACCSLVQQTFQTDKPCFCSITPLFHKDTANFTAFFKLCNTTSSEAEFDSFCAGSTPPPAEAPMSSLPLGNLPGAIFG